MANTISATPIEAATKGEVKRLRNSGFVPISIQHKGEDTLHLQGERKPIEDFILHYGRSTAAEIEVNGDRHTALVSHVQRDPITHRLIQVTFQKLLRGDKVKTAVSVHLHGTPEAVRMHTGLVQHQLEVVELRCDAARLPDHLEADISGIDFHTPFRVSDLPASADYEVITPAETVIASLASVGNQSPDSGAPAASSETTEETGA